jgi:hypothetical protein
MQKFALKRLTASDLTFFKWHFENNNAGNQKAINLSRNVFIDALYPSLPDVIAERNDGKLPLTLYTYGPGLAEAYPLQRKIIKSIGYKNWRLNGEFIFTPEETPDRFNVLKPNDIAIMGFEGAVSPTALHIDYLAEALDTDKALRDAADVMIGNQRGSMKEITLGELAALVQRVNPVENHPIRRFFVDSDVIEAVQGDAQARLRVFRRTGRIMSQEELKAARQKAEETGKAGEELIATYFEGRLEDQSINGYEWIAHQNAVAPYDFKLIDTSGFTSLLDVKSTTGAFSAPLHISMAEIDTMANTPERYDLYRVYSLDEKGGKLRIARDMRGFAKSLVDIFSALPTGVRIDGISLDPAQMDFGQEEYLTFPDDEE